MKTRMVVVRVRFSAGLVTGAFAARGRGNSGAGRGSGTANRGTMQSGVNCDQSGPGQGPPVRDGSGKAGAPGKGAKAGPGNQADGPVPPIKQVPRDKTTRLRRRA